MDLIGKRAAIVIEGQEIHTRTGFLRIPKDILHQVGANLEDVNIPVTHAKIMGWYDNEFGSYVTCLGYLTEHVASQLA